MPYDPSVKLESAGLQPLPRPGVAAVQHGHAVPLRHGVYRAEEAREVPLRVDVLLPVGGQQDVFTLLQPQPLMDVRRLYLLQVVVQHLRHRGAGDEGPLLGHPALYEVPPRVLRVAEVDVRDDVHYPSVGLLGQALVLAAVAGLHVEDGYVEPLGSDDAQAAVGVPEHQHGVGPRPRHQLVRGVYDVAHRGPEVVPHGVHVHVRVPQLEVPEEHPVEAIVVVLPRVCQQAVEVLPALGDYGGQADDLRPRADDYQQPQPAVVLEPYVRIVCSDVHVDVILLVSNMCPASPGRRSRSPT